MSQTRDQQRFTVSEVAVCALDLEIWEPQEPVTSTLLFLRSIQITVVVDFIDRNKKASRETNATDCMLSNCKSTATNYKSK